MRATTAIKVLNTTDDLVRVGGYGVVFGGMDLEGEQFGPDTNFMLDLVPAKLVLYDHGQNTRVGKSIIGRTAKVEPDDVGLWVEAELDRHASYMEQVLKLAAVGALGWSSGSVGHLTQREGKSITSWPIIEFSLTPTPAEPRTLGVDVLKSLAQIDESFEALLPEGSAATDPVQDANETEAAPIIEIVSSMEGKTVSEETTPQADQTLEYSEELKAMKGQIGDLSTAINQVLQFVQDSPKVKNAGYVTMDGGKADPNVKSFGDWLLAVQRGDTDRLRTVYKSVKGMSEGSGTAGGFLVPQAFEQQLMSVAEANSIVRSRASIMPVSLPSGTIPSLDQYTAPTAGVGHSALAGGVVAAWAEEGASVAETTPVFKQLEWNVKKLAGYTKATNESVSDSAISIEALLTNLFGRAIAAMEDYAFLRGSGVGQPLGILEADCTIGVATTGDNAFVMGDALNMLAQYWSYLGRTTWIMHPGVLPDLGGSTFGTTGNAMPYVSPRENFGGAIQLAQPLLGYPIFLSEHMPNANTDDVILADLSAYVIFDRAGLAISFSEHVNFLTDEATWKFTKRMDGKPWLKGKITLGSPTAYEVSPFLYHND